MTNKPSSVRVSRELLPCPIYRQARPATAKVDERAEFEAWAQTQCMQLKKDGLVTTYAYERTDLAWNTWQARAKLNGGQS